MTLRTTFYATFFAALSCLTAHSMVKLSALCAKQFQFRPIATIKTTTKPDFTKKTVKKAIVKEPVKDLAEAKKNINEYTKLVYAIKAVESTKDYKADIYKKDIVKLFIIGGLGIALQPYLMGALPLSAFIGVALTSHSLISTKLKKDVYESPLFKAARENDHEMVKALIAAGIDINKQNYFFRETPLMIAAQNGYTDIICELIKSGADIRCCDRKKQTALMYAKDNNQDKALALLQRAQDKADSIVIKINS